MTGAVRVYATCLACQGGHGHTVKSACDPDQGRSPVHQPNMSTGIPTPTCHCVAQTHASSPLDKIPSFSKPSTASRVSSSAPDGFRAGHHSVHFTAHPRQHWNGHGHIASATSLQANTLQKTHVNRIFHLHTGGGGGAAIRSGCCSARQGGGYV